MMLVLTRRVGEKIRIGKDIIIVPLGVNGNQIKLGFDAPREVQIVRIELLGREKPKIKEKPVITIKSKKRINKESV